MVKSWYPPRHHLLRSHGCLHGRHIRRSAGEDALTSPQPGSSTEVYDWKVPIKWMVNGDINHMDHFGSNWILFFGWFMITKKIHILEYKSQELMGIGHGAMGMGTYF